MFITTHRVILKGKKVLNGYRFCYIDFEERSAVIKALQLNDKEIKGRKMFVDFEDTTQRVGFKYRNDQPSKYNKEYQKIQKGVLEKKRVRPEDGKTESK